MQLHLLAALLALSVLPAAQAPAPDKWAEVRPGVWEITLEVDIPSGVTDHRVSTPPLAGPPQDKPMGSSHPIKLEFFDLDSTGSILQVENLGAAVPHAIGTVGWQVGSIAVARLELLSDQTYTSTSWLASASGQLWYSQNGPAGGIAYPAFDGDLDYGGASGFTHSFVEADPGSPVFDSHPVPFVNPAVDTSQIGVEMRFWDWTFPPTAYPGAEFHSIHSTRARVGVRVSYLEPR